VVFLPDAKMIPISAFAEHQSHAVIKCHYANPSNICPSLPISSKMLTITRNLKDMLVSLALYVRYDKVLNKGDHYFKAFVTGEHQSRMTDYDFINDFVLTQDWASYVMPIYSSYTHERYWKTTYELLVKDTITVVRDLANYLNINCNVEDVVAQSDFKTITGRDRGDAFHNSEFLRKGIVGDYQNWLRKEAIDFIDNKKLVDKVRARI